MKKEILRVERIMSTEPCEKIFLRVEFLVFTTTTLFYTNTHTSKGEIERDRQRRREIGRRSDREKK